MPSSYKINLAAGRLPGMLLLLVFLAACSKAPAPAPAAPGKAESKAGASSAATGAEISKTPAQSVHESVFLVPANARDPFFPKSARTREKPAEGKAPAPVDVRAKLQEGFAGVMGNSERRLALVHNTILHSGRTALISLEANGQQVEVRVKVLEITRNSVTLQVQGFADPVKLVRQRSTQ